MKLSVLLWIGIGISVVFVELFYNEVLLSEVFFDMLTAVIFALRVLLCLFSDLGIVEAFVDLEEEVSEE